MNHMCNHNALALMMAAGLAVAIPGICNASGVAATQHLENNAQGRSQVGATENAHSKATQPHVAAGSAQERTKPPQNKPSQSKPPQNEPSQSKPPQKLGSVQVIGSLIPRPALTGNAAVHVFTDQDMKLNGTVSVQQMLMRVPSAFVVSSSTNDTETAFSTVNLRGLGANRTLVLINGNRFVRGDTSAFHTGNTDQNGANLNFIPAPLVKRVEVLTGGASAIYGSEAIGGVVNFVMKDHFSGLEFDLNANESSHRDGFTMSPTIIWGSNSADGRGNVTLYASFSKQHAVRIDARSRLRCPTVPNADFTERVCITSQNSQDTSFISLDRPAGDDNGFIAPDGSRVIIPGNSTAAYTFDHSKFYLQHPQTDYHFGGFAHYDFNKHLQVHGSVMFMQSTVGLISPPGQVAAEQFLINCDNPLLSAQESGFLCPNPGQTQANVVLTRRFVSTTRTRNLRNTEHRIHLALTGDIDAGWKYNVSAQHSEDSNSENLLRVLRNRVAQALQVTTDATGQPVCVNTPGCVPLDLFALNGVTQDQLNYILLPTMSEGSTAEFSGKALVTGDLGHYGITSPLATHGISVAAGMGYRRDSLHFLPGAAEQSGGSPTRPVDGHFNDLDVYSEIHAPIIEDRPFAQDLSVDVAYRLSQYKIATRPGHILIHTYKAGLRYAPSRSIALRASWNRSARVPDVQELFFPQTVSTAAAPDPCAGANPAASLDECARSGVTPAQYGNIQQCSTFQCSVLVGGNLELDPESSITRQLGLVFTPQSLQGLSATVDYYDISLDSAIGSVPPIDALGNCLNDGKFCDLIHRGPTGELFGDASKAFINATNINTGFIRTRGFDLTVDLLRGLSDLGLGNNGSVHLRLNSTYVWKFVRKVTRSSGAFDCAGFYGLVCGVSHPRWRSRLGLVWSDPMGVTGLSLSVLWRNIHSVKLDSNTGNPLLNPGRAPFNPLDAKLPSVNYVNVAGSYSLPTSLREDISLRFGIENITNQKPPVITFASLPSANSSSAASSTFASLYDVMGTTFFAGITVHFH